MWAMMFWLWIGKRRTISATGEVRALCASTSRRTPAPSKNAMPKPSLCSSARVAKPVKLNITSVGVLAFRPSSWHIVLFQEQAMEAFEAHQVARVAGLVEHAGHAPHETGVLLCAPDQQVGQPRVAVHAVGALVEIEARLEREQLGFVAFAHL